MTSIPPVRVRATPRQPDPSDDELDSLARRVGVPVQSPNEDDELAQLAQRVSTQPFRMAPVVASKPEESPAQPLRMRPIVASHVEELKRSLTDEAIEARYGPISHAPTASDFVT